MGDQTSTDHPATGVEMQDLHTNVCEDVYDAAGLSIGIVNAVLLELIGQVHRY
jgi:hypothetical protein